MVIPVDVFSALAHPVRRRVLEQVSERPRTMGDLADGFDLGRAAVGEHVQVLRRAGLVDAEAVGRKMIYRLAPGRLAEVVRWVALVDDSAWPSGDHPAAPGAADVGTASVSADQLLPGPRETAWRAITEPALVGSWWTEADIAPVVGHTFHLGARDGDPMPCQVTVARPLECLAFRMAPGWTVTWALEEEGDGTRAFLEHSGFDLGRDEDRDAFAHLVGAWRHRLLPDLARLVETLQAEGRSPAR